MANDTYTCVHTTSPVVVTRPYVSYLPFQEGEPAIAVGSRAHLQDEAVAQVRKLEFFPIRFFVELASLIGRLLHYIPKIHCLYDAQFSINRTKR